MVEWLLLTVAFALGVSLEQWFSKCGPWSSTISITWNLFEMQILDLPARPIWMQWF